MILPLTLLNKHFKSSRSRQRSLQQTVTSCYPLLSTATHGPYVISHALPQACMPLAPLLLEPQLLYYVCIRVL
jgi:hypothetical protein